MKTKQEANYVEHSKVNQCKNCEHFKPTIMHCTIVEGVINPCGSCKYYERY